MARQKSYYELLKHPKWQKKRLEIMEEHGFRCEDCGAEDKMLQIHHSFYEKGLLPWEYPNQSLHCLCEDCHREAQDYLTLLHRQIGELDLMQIERLLGYAMGLVTSDCPMVTLDIASYEVASGVADVYQLRTDEVIHAIEDGVIDGYKLSALQDVKRGHPGWTCGICGRSANELFLEQIRGDENPYETLIEHAVHEHGLDRDKVMESHRTHRDRRLVDGKPWMQLGY